MAFRELFEIFTVLISLKLCIFLVLLYWLLWIIYARFFHPYADLPGPFLASISRLWLIHQVSGGQAEVMQRKLHQKHGPIVRIAPNEVSISDPEAIKIIYGIKSNFTKTDFYPPFRSDISKYPDHLTNLDNRQHAERKKIVSSIYSASSVLESENHINACTSLLLQRMGEYAAEKANVNLSDWCQFFTFDVIGELYFGKMFGFMYHRSDQGGWIRSLDTLFPVVTTACVTPSYLRFLQPITAIFTPRALESIRCFGTMVKASKDCVHERKQQINDGKQPRKDLLAMLFEIMNLRGKQSDFSTLEVQQEAFVAIFAGSDTTAIALRSIFYHLVKTPTAYQRLVCEIDEATRDGRLSVPHVKYLEAIELPYLTAVCKEGMRIHPSVAFTMPRAVPAGGCKIAGRFFNAGDRVGINAAVVHFDKTVFGEDADIFNPSRWIDGSKNPRELDRYMLQFSSGARGCLGKNIALVEIYKVVPQLLRDYRLELVKPHENWVTHNFFLNKQTNMDVKVYKR